MVAGALTPLLTDIHSRKESKTLRIPACLALFAIVPALPIGAATDLGKSSQISITSPLHIPGAVLDAGTYRVSLEDRMYDRAIVQISGEGKQYLLLTVPDPQMAKGAAKPHLVIVQGSASNDQYATGFVCANCKAPLEFAYPKAEAVDLAKATVKPVLAVDPASDKLPPLGSLTQADMKVVSLWMLTPSRVSPDADVQIAAAHYQAPAGTEVASAAPAAAPERQQRLPQTASNDFNFAIAGLIALAGAALVGQRRRRLGRV